MAGYTVGYFVGSLAAKSINRLLAKALVRVAPPELHMTEISFKDLPLYSYDYDSNYPPIATEFKNAIVAVDAVLFVTPEYNRSIPGALKNAIDWASRPYGSPITESESASATLSTKGWRTRLKSRPRRCAVHRRRVLMAVPQPVFCREGVFDRFNKDESLRPGRAVQRQSI